MDRPDPTRLPQSNRRWMTAPRPGALLGAALLLGLVILAADKLHERLPENVSILLFLTAVLISAAAFGFWTGIASALGAIAAFNLLFVEPHFTLHIANTQDVVTLAVFLLVAGLTGLLAGRLREQVDAAKDRAAALEVLSRVSTDLAQAASVQDVARIAIGHLHDLARGPAMALTARDGNLVLLAAEPADHLPDASALDAADIAFRRGRAELAAARGWSGSRLSFYPLGTDGRDRLVLGHARLIADRRDREWREQAIEVVLGQADQALQRLSLSRAAEVERRRAAAEETRAALLASLSHDLRTPLATIMGAVTTLRELGATLPPAAQTDLLMAMEEETRRLARYVEKLLQLTRLQAGLAAQMAWVDAGDVAQAAVARARRAWPQAQITLDLAPLPMIRAEAGLLEQALFNLLENAVRHSPGPIRLSGAADQGEIVLTVRDSGAGLDPAIMDWLDGPDMTGPPSPASGPAFNTAFNTGRATGGTGSGGTGLGLSICKGIARALGGRIGAARAETGGAALSIRLPIPPDRA